MNGLVLLAQADAAGPVRQIAEQFGVSWAHLIAQIISFGIVCFLLHRFAYRPVLAMLEFRREEISRGLANAEKIKADLARTEEERKKVLAEAGAQATKIIEETRAAAERELNKRSQEAVAAANQILAKAREASEAELVRMKAELRKEIGRLVVETSAKVTGKILTVQDQQRLAEETNKELAA
jgi:F-type H+-transporting ATPase subunit b